MTASEKTSLEDREPLYLINSTIDFTVIVHDDKFDNEDNLYGELKLVIFNNMNGTMQNQIVPLKNNCSKGFSEDNVFSTSKYKRYCPDFSDEHYLKNEYYSDKSAWMRLSLNECDSKKRKCASRREIDNYFRKTILEILMKSVKPSLSDYDSP